MMKRIYQKEISSLILFFFRYFFTISGCQTKETLPSVSISIFSFSRRKLMFLLKVL